MDLTENPTPEENEAFSLLWQDRKRCVVRAICGVADAFGTVIKPQLVRDLVQTDSVKWDTRYQLLQTLGVKSHSFNIDDTLTIVNELVDQINHATHAQIPHPEIVPANSFVEALQLTPRGELTIFMDPFPGHDSYHAVHVGTKSALVENQGKRCIQDKYESLPIDILTQAFKYKATHVALFHKK